MLFLIHQGKIFFVNRNICCDISSVDNVTRITLSVRHSDVEDFKTTGNQTKKLVLLPQNKIRTRSRIGKQIFCVIKPRPAKSTRKYP